MNKIILHRLLKISLVVGLLSTSTAFAESYLLLQPNAFYRGTGAPKIETITFSALDTESSYTVNVYISRLGGRKRGRKNKRKRTSAIIRLNGSVIFARQKFKRNKTFLTKSIGVNSTNQLDVKLSGKSGGVITIEIVGEDNIAPTISAIVTPIANASAWHNTQAQVSYECSDMESGIATCPDAKTINIEAANQIIPATAVDIAGNEATATITLNIDKTNPEIASMANPLANASDWHKTSVIVSYLCSDSLSGVLTCSEPETVPGEGANQTVTGMVADIADNINETTHRLNIDLSPPAISSALSVQPNAAGWLNQDVTVSFLCSDALSGYVDCPLDKVITTEAASQTISDSVSDIAGNTTSTSIILNLDKTAPVITSALVPLANANGWNNSSVSVNFDCLDALSGIADCSAPVTVSLEGENQSVPGQGSDIAGNTTAISQSLSIDLSAPLISTSLSLGANINGWHNADVTTTFNCSDALSGTATCTAPNTLSIEGANQVIDGSVTDNAGNSTSTTINLSLDKTPPALTATVNPLPNANNWNNSAVTIDFDCQDTLSGMADCSPQAVVSVEGGNQIIPGQGADLAGNSSAITHTLNIDLTPPVISSALSAQPNAAGWLNQDVTVSFLCSDALSGYVDCPLDKVITTEAASQTISDSVSDIAGNSTSTSIILNLDKTAPVITSALVPLANANGWNNSSVSVTFDCLDALSGIADCSAPVTVSLEGENQSVPGQGSDIAGNTTAISQSLNIDLSAPTISTELSAIANVAGWHNSNFVISYICADTLSGIATCPTAKAVETEGGNQAVAAATSDRAGNASNVSTTVHLDKTPPLITATTNPLPNVNGWHKSAATVGFDCEDPLSGIASCSPGVLVETEGAAQTLIGLSVDIADNTTEINKVVKIDLTPPTITTQFSASANAADWYNTPVTLSFTCDDLLSGIETCPAPVAISEDNQGISIAVNAIDIAGNTVEQSHVINLDATAPQIIFTAPTAGVELATLRPVIELTLSDNMIIDETSFALTVNDSPFTGSCSISDGAALCTPSSDFPRGAIELRATVTDLAGNGTTVAHNFLIQLDTDNDGVPDVDDKFPLDPNEWADLDDDNIGDNSDPDIDGDGIGNDYEIEVGTDPTDPASFPPDFDGDGIPDSIDDDFDGDGVPNATDIFPFDPAESADLDGDGIGDNADTDRDGDGFSNEEEILEGSNPDDASDIPGSNLRISFAAGTLTTTESQFVDLSGSARGDSVDRVFLTNDQFAGSPFSATLTNDAWSSRVALRVGTNTITAHIDGNSGEVAEAVTIIERTEAPLVVGITFDNPANNSLFNEPDIVVSGRVTSETAIELPQVLVNNTAAQVAQGASPTEFTFSAPVVLQQGSNTITANTVIAGQPLQQSLTVIYQPEAEAVLPPAVTITSPTPGKTLVSDSFVLSVLVLSDAGLASVAVNGQTETVSASGQIEKTLSFSGSNQLDVSIVATDNLNQTSVLNASYTLDLDPPVIVIDDLQAYPGENLVTENPYPLTGTVSDATLLQITLNGQALTLEPTTTEHQYRFNANLMVPIGISNSITFEAFDAAGNTSSVEYLINANSDIQVEWLSPASDAQVLLEGAGQVIGVSARLSSIIGIGNIELDIVDQITAPVTLTLDTDIASGQITLPETSGDYRLRITVRDTAGEILSTSTRVIQLQVAEAIPLSVIKMTPADEAIDVEPNDFAAVFFNKPVQLDLLNIELFETVHGLSYIDADPPGVDSINAKGYVLEEVNRDYEPVPGVYSLLANNATVVFYPQRDLAYGADLYLIINYAGEEMSRRHFKVRPRPTFIEGAVFDNLAQPISGIEITIPELNRTTVSDKNGAYNFGYGDAANQTLPGGSYTLIANASLRDRRFASFKNNINLQAGTVNSISNINLALLNQEVPFSYLNSNAVNVINGDELSLDASNAGFTFSNGDNQGAAHVQFLVFSSIRVPAFRPIYSPQWAYAAQPSGIQVNGDLQISLAVPAYQGGYDHAPEENELVLLLGNNAENTSLIPVGVGQAITGHRIQSVGRTHYQRLDTIAYARVVPDLWPELNAYKKGELDIDQLTLKLQVFNYLPPASEAEAIERANAIMEQMQ